MLKRQHLSGEQRQAIAEVLWPGSTVKSKSQADIDAICKVGRHRVAPRLYLNVARGGTRSWVFRYMVDGKAREMGIGAYPRVSYAEALARARELRTGFFDPVAVRRQIEKMDRAEQWDHFKQGDAHPGYRLRGVTIPMSDRGTHERQETERTRERRLRRLKRMCETEGVEFDPADWID